jgi:O-antigen/teichoic acid export membrane protein
MAKLSAKGGFNLFLGVSISSVVSAAGVIILMRLLTPSEYGLVAIAMISPTLISLFRDWGMNSAMIKYVAQYRSENKIAKVRNIVASGILFELVVGVTLSLSSFLLAGFLATNLFHRSETKTLIEIASLIILAGSFFTASQSVFTGFERMEFNSLIMICQSCFKCFLASLLVLLGYSSLGAVVGQTVAVVITGVIGIVIFFLIFYRNIRGRKNDELNFSGTLKTMLRYGLPLSVSTILSGFLPQFYYFMMAIYCSDSAIGNFQAAVNFTVLITFFTIPIATVLFPAFSKLKPEKEMETLRIVFQSSVKYAAMLTIPATVMVMVLSNPLVFAIVGTKWSDVPFFLILYSISFLYSGLGNLSLENFLNGLGETKVTMKLALISLGVGLPLSLTLIPMFGIPGLIVTTWVVGIPSLAVGLWWIRRHFGATIDWVSSTKIFLASGMAAVITHIIISQLNFQYWVELVIGGITFLIVYLVAAPLIKAVDKNDINSLREMLSGLGPFAHLFQIPLNIIEKLLTIFAF